MIEVWCSPDRQYIWTCDNCEMYSESYPSAQSVYEAAAIHADTPMHVSMCSALTDKESRDAG